MKSQQESGFRMVQEAFQTTEYQITFPPEEEDRHSSNLYQLCGNIIFVFGAGDGNKFHTC
jgi:hypothetical protein